MPPKVRIIDRGWNKLKRMFIAAGSGKAASVGIQGNEAALVEEDHGGMTNIELGAIHEFGSKKIANRPPSRSFIRKTFDNNVRKYEVESIRIAGLFFDGYPMSVIEGELFILGEMYKADIVNFIKKGIPPKLKNPSRKRREKGLTPLWATGQLVGSLTTIVDDAVKVKAIQ